MEFNPSRCKVVHVKGSIKTIKTDYVLHGQVLEFVPCARYLRVDISSGLTWNSHFDRVTANANQTLEFIRRSIKTKMQKVREAAYTSLVRSQLEYTSAVDSNITNQTNPAKSCSLDDRQASVTEMVTSVFAYFTR